MARDTVNYGKENAPKTAYSHMSGHGWGVCCSLSNYRCIMLITVTVYRPNNLLWICYFVLHFNDICIYK